MEESLIRSAMLLGEGGIKKLQNAHVAVFGVGGVGSFAAEAIARSGVGKIDLFDNDTVSVSNINRQLVADFDTVGQKKTEVMKKRIIAVNPKADVNTYNIFYGQENAGEFDFAKYDYVIDAIDTVSSKLLLVENAKAKFVPVISAMGAGNKLDPTAFEVTDIYKTSGCPLARVMRRELKKRGIQSLLVVYSKEEPLKPLPLVENAEGKRQTPGSVSFVPSVCGLIIAGQVIKDIALK